MPEKFNQRVAELLLEQRLAAGLTQAVFAVKHHADPETYKSWETGTGPLPDIAHAFSLLEMLGAENRERLGLFIGPLMDTIRGLPLSETGPAFEALDIILKQAPKRDKEQWIAALVDAAAEYSGFPKKRAASVRPATRAAAKRKAKNNLLDFRGEVS